MNSSLTFTLQIQWICASSLRHRLFCVAAAMAQVSTACSITFFTHVVYTLSLSARSRLRLVRRQGAGSRTCLYHICMVLQQPARNNRQQRACPLDSKTLRQPQAFLFQPLRFYVVFVWRGFLFLWVLGMGYVILLWHSLSLHYNYFTTLTVQKAVLCLGIRRT